MSNYDYDYFYKQLEEESKEAEIEEMDPKIQSIINDWKRQYTDIYLISIGDSDFIYRLITNKEYLELRNRYENRFTLSEKICELCVLDPEDYNWKEDELAGHVETLSTEILNNSGVVWNKDEIKEAMKQEEEELSSLTTLIMLTIKKSFPEYTLEEIESWNFKKQLKLYSYAKWLINVGGTDFDLEFQGEEA